MTPEELEYANKQADNMRDLMNANRSKDDAIRASYTDNYELSKRLESAEARAAELLDENRELSESVATLRAALDQASMDYANAVVEYTAQIAQLERELIDMSQKRDTWYSECKQLEAHLAGAAQTVTQLTRERDEACQDRDSLRMSIVNNVSA